MLNHLGFLPDDGAGTPAQNVVRGQKPGRACDVGVLADDLDLLRRLLQPLSPGSDCSLVARNLLHAFGSIGGVLAADGQRLTGEIGHTAAWYLNHLHIVLQHVLRERIKNRPLIGSWQALKEYLSASLRHDTREKLLVLFLDRKNGLIRDEVMQQGTVDHVPAYPREIVKRALELDASAIIMVHNHPSGDPSPSNDDIEMTKQVVAALAAVGITVHDHAIVGKNEIVSLRALRCFS